MSLTRQILIIVLLGGLVAGGTYWYQATTAQEGGGEAAGTRPPTLVEVEPAARAIIVERIEAVGTTLARQSIDVVANASGRVREITFEPGQHVEQGALLVRLDDEIERAAVVEAEAVLEEARTAFERTRQLAESRSVAAAVLDEARAQMISAQARLDAARRRFEDRAIRAAFGGTVGLKATDVGAMVDDTSILTTLDDLSEIEIDFTVSEVHFNKVSRGQAVRASAVAFPGETFEGRIKVIDSRVERATRAFALRASIPNQNGRLPAGMFVRVELVTGEREALMVDEAAILAEAERSFLFVAAEGRAVQREVVLGSREPGRVEVTSGLSEGEPVITSGIDKIRNGSPIRIAGEPPPGGDGAPPPRGGAPAAGA